MEEKIKKLIDYYDVEIEKDHLKKVVRNREYNGVVMSYYSKLATKTSHSLFKRKEERMAECNKLWEIDKYEESKVKDFKRTCLCRDKFCSNCKKVMQASRMSRFIPFIRPYSPYLYQLTLTIPNVQGPALADGISRLTKAYGMLMSYLSGRKEIKGIDFTLWGYEGAIRSLEVTVKRNNEYHPHLHAAIVLKSKMGEQKYRNKYSVDHLGKREDRLFSEQEILIQKIWYLLTNRIKVTKKAIDDLEVGYSCTLDKFKEDDFLELFKYMTKSTTEEDKLLTYKQFTTLYFALKSVRQIQGYGCFFNIKDGEISVEEADDLYRFILDELRQKESPVETWQSPEELVKDRDYILISRKRIYKHLKDILKKD